MTLTILSTLMTLMTVIKYILNLFNDQYNQNNQDANTQDVNNHIETFYEIPLVLLQSLAGFILLQILLSILFKFYKFPNKYFNASYTLIFCILSLNISTYMLTDLFEKYSKVGGITSLEYTQMLIYKIKLSYFAMSYFIVDLLCNVNEIEFVLHHVATIIYLIFHNDLNDMIMLFCLFFGEITNPVLLLWKVSKKDFPHIHYHLSPINFVLFALVRVFILIGIVLHSTLKYHQQTNSDFLKFLNWIIFIGFNIGNFYWICKISRNFHNLTLTSNKKTIENK